VRSRAENTNSHLLCTLRDGGRLGLVVLAGCMLAVSAAVTVGVVRMTLPAKSTEPLPMVRLTPATGPLRVNPANPRYFTDDSGRAILLTGSHTWYSLQDAGNTDPPPAFNYDEWLDYLSGYGHNFFRLFVWEQARWTVQSGVADYYYYPPIYSRPGPGIALDGKAKFDLTTFNQDFFDRLRQRVIQAGNHGFYVSIQLFQGFSIDKANFYPSDNAWMGHPYNASNNINGVDGDPAPSDNHGDQIQQGNLPAIVDLQEAYVRKVIDTVNDLDNVLYEICNESDIGEDEYNWQNHFIDYIHTYEAGKAKQHPVGLTTPYGPGYADNSPLFASNADWISPSADDPYETDPPASDGTKIIINDTDHLWGIGGDRVWAWKSFLRGLHPIFMDTYSDYDEWDNSDPRDPPWESLRKNLGYILTYANRMNLAAMAPRSDLCSTGYCLANPAVNGAEYLVYLPAGGTATVNLSAAAGQLSVEWFNPGTGTTSPGGTTTGGTSRNFNAPFGGDAVLYIHQ
jgi:hypothetical protein